MEFRDFGCGVQGLFGGIWMWSIAMGLREMDVGFRCHVMAQGVVINYRFGTMGP